MKLILTSLLLTTLTVGTCFAQTTSKQTKKKRVTVTNQAKMTAKKQGIEKWIIEKMSQGIDIDKNFKCTFKFSGREFIIEIRNNDKLYEISKIDIFNIVSIVGETRITGLSYLVFKSKHEMPFSIWREGQDLQDESVEYLFNLKDEENIAERLFKAFKELQILNGKPKEPF